jgi:hypothetical protein
MGGRAVGGRGGLPQGAQRARFSNVRQPNEFIWPRRAPPPPRRRCPARLAAGRRAHGSASGRGGEHTGPPQGGAASTRVRLRAGRRARARRRGGPGSAAAAPAPRSPARTRARARGGGVVESARENDALGCLMDISSLPITIRNQFLKVSAGRAARAVLSGRRREGCAERSGGGRF